MYYTEINHWTGTIWPSPDDISCTRPEGSDISHSVGGTELCRHKAEHFCFYPVTLSVLRQGRALQEGTIPFLTTCIEFHYNSLGETQRQVLHFTQSQCERAVSDFNTHYCWALPFFFFEGGHGCALGWRTCCLSIFYLGQQKGCWMVKLRSKQVAAITQASHAENLLTVMQIIIPMNFFLQPDGTPCEYGEGTESSMRLN